MRVFTQKKILLMQRKNLCQEYFYIEQYASRAAEMLSVKYASGATEMLSVKYAFGTEKMISVKLEFIKN